MSSVAAKFFYTKQHPCSCDGDHIRNFHFTGWRIDTCKSIYLIISVCSFALSFKYASKLTKSGWHCPLLHSVNTCFSWLCDKTLLTDFLFLQVANANVSLQRLEELFLDEERNLKQNPPIEPGLPAISIENGYFSWDPKVKFSIILLYTATILLKLS